MKARLLRWLGDLWYRRPVVIRNSTLTDRIVGAREKGWTVGYERGLVESIRGKRATSTGRVLHGLPGGVA